jgi:hypothetical protein
VKFRFIAAEKAHHSLLLLCRCLRVTRSGFYAWQQRPESVHAQRDRQLKVLVRASFTTSKGRYGSPRILRDLLEQQEHVSRKRVIRLMQEDGGGAARKLDQSAARKVIHLKGRSFYACCSFQALLCPWPGGGIGRSSGRAHCLVTDARG